MDFLLLVLKRRLASYAPIQLVTTGNPVNSYFTCTVDKTHHGPVIALFPVRLLQIFWYARGVPVTNLFCCHWWCALAITLEIFHYITITATTKVILVIYIYVNNNKKIESQLKKKIFLPLSECLEDSDISHCIFHRICLFSLNRK